jgi:hypothetical protein
MSTPACFARLQIMEQKGLDIVRRDWCPLSKDVGNHALKAILSGAPREDVVNSIHEHLEDVKEKVCLLVGMSMGTCCLLASANYHKSCALACFVLCFTTACCGMSMPTFVPRPCAAACALALLSFF